LAEKTVGNKRIIMAIYIDVTFRNTTAAQQVCTATDDVLAQLVLNEPLASGAVSTPRQLVQAPDGYGHATYGYNGGVSTRRIDIGDGEQLDIG
jgi:hypothetical protein